MVDQSFPVFRKVLSTKTVMMTPAFPLTSRLSDLTPLGRGKNTGRNSGLEENIQIQSVIKSFLWIMFVSWVRNLVVNLQFYFKIDSGQISSRPHATDFPQVVVVEREIPLFQGNLGWWNIIIWPDRLLKTCFFHVSNEKKPSYFPLYWLVNRDPGSL